MTPKRHPIKSHDPEHTTLSGFNICSVWAISGSLAATTEITIVFFSWGYLDVSVHLVRLWSLCIQQQMSRHYTRQVSPFRNLRIKACLAAPRSLSQLATSFIASWRQGIHRLPLIAWPQNNRYNHAEHLLYPYPNCQTANMNDSSITTKNKMPIDTLLSAGGNRVRTDERSTCKAGRSTCLPHRPIISDGHINGGGERVRTDDLLRARQALSQLSYTPNRIDYLRLTIEN